MIKKFLSLFSGKSSPAEERPTAADAAPADVTRPKKAVDPEKSVSDIVSFVDYVVRALVDTPAAVKIEMIDDEKGQVINIRCEKEDIGKIIGKNGKTIMAIRSLVAGAGSRLNRQMNVEVIDQVAN